MCLFKVQLNTWFVCMNDEHIYFCISLYLFSAILFAKDTFTNILLCMTINDAV
jgi:hypothetical protein